MSTATTKQDRPKVDLVSLVDKADPEQRAIAFYILRARQKRKLAKSTERKRGSR